MITFYKHKNFLDKSVASNSAVVLTCNSTSCSQLFRVLLHYDVWRFILTKNSFYRKFIHLGVLSHKLHSSTISLGVIMVNDGCNLRLEYVSLY